MVIQDGLGAQLDVTLARPAVLRVKLEPARMPSLVVRGADRVIRDRLRQPSPRRLCLIPERWWPTLPTDSLSRAESSKLLNFPASPLAAAHPGKVVEFRGLGGPFRKGLIAAWGSDESEPFRIVGHYDLDQSAEAVITGLGTLVTQFDLPESAGIESWAFPVRASYRLFYAMLSPTALFWRAAGDDQPLWFKETRSTDPSALVPLKHAVTGKGAVQGFAPHPYLPVLFESTTGGSWMSWTSEASEYELSGLPPGVFRVRALDLFGLVTFATGFLVLDGTTTVAPRLWAKVDLDEPESREVMGFVRWESGLPAAKAAVFMQNSYNFRKYLQRVESDEHGYYRFGNVPGGEPYFVFAVPPGDENSIRNFEYFGVGPLQREVWRSLELHPHRISGSLNPLFRMRESEARPDSGWKALLHLARIEGKAESIVWSFRAEPSGKFAVANVAHGRYCVQSSQNESGTFIRSLPFEVGDGQSETIVQWASQ